MRSKLFIAGMLLLPLALVAAVCGSETTRIENTGGDDIRGITVSGEGKVTAPPDLAMVTLGVSALRPTVAEARESAAASLTAMLDAMKANGVDEKDIQTQSLSIYPEYDYNDGNQLLRGFRVQNTVIAKIRDIDTTSDVVDAAVTAGGDNTSIQGISFTIDDPATLREEARRKAVEDARARAQTLASASGVDVGRPVNITESSYAAPIPYDMAAGAAERQIAADTATPIEVGELDVLVTVNVTWEIVH